MFIINKNYNKEMIMNYAYFRSCSDYASLATQENSIDKYLLKNSCKVDKKKIEISSFGQPLEDRKDFIDFLHSLKDKDKLFIYDLSAFSIKVGEVVKVLNCIFKKDIDIIISRFNIKIDSSSHCKTILSLLNEVREGCKRIKKSGIGRPKGSLSKSKYDLYRDKIIIFLKEGRSVNEISKILKVSRSSLRDYIVSRGLKELVSKKSDTKEEKALKLLDSECRIISNKG